MRIVFTIYAVSAAALCFLLTTCLTFLTDDHLVENIAVKLFNLTYLLFGPLLLIYCLYGLLYIKGLMFECYPFMVSSNINFMDLFVLFACFMFSSMVTMFFSMHKAVEMAQTALTDETSVFYRCFMNYLKYKRHYSSLSAFASQRQPASSLH